MLVCAAKILLILLTQKVKYGVKGKENKTIMRKQGAPVELERHENEL